MPRIAANLSFMFQDIGFLDRFDAAARALFKAVEFLFPYDHPPETIAERLERNIGEIHYPYLFDRFDEIGYSSWIGCEYRPVGETAAGLGGAKRYGIGNPRCTTGVRPSRRRLAPPQDEDKLMMAIRKTLS